MDELVLSYRGLDLLKATEDHIRKLVPNLSEPNIREFAELYQIDPLEAMLNMRQETALMFSVVRNGEVLGLTGLTPDEPIPVMWSVFHKDMKKHWVKFARGSTKLVQYYHTFSPVLACEVWDQNEMIHYWLLSLGFEPEVHFEFGNGKLGVIRFTRTQRPKVSVLSQTPRPVIH